MSLKDKFNKLKTTIIGVKTSDIDTKLDKAVKDIVSYKSNSNRAGYIELVKTLISKSNIGSFDNQSVFLQNQSPNVFGQAGRLSRYKTYESIVYNINYCQRALSVLVDNILSPDDITKICLSVTPSSYLEDEIPTESKVTHVKEVIQNINIEKKLSVIVKNTLLYGDFFAEIADSKTALTSKSILSEHQFLSNYSDSVFNKSSEKDIITTSINDKHNLKINISYSLFSEDSNKERNINNLHVIFHEPSRVVKLQSSLFPLCFGYLIFPRTSVSQALSLEDQVINDLCSKILQSISKRIPQSNEFENIDDLKDIIKHMIKQTNFDKMMNIRYVPPEKIVHFNIPSSRYYPYGESIFDSSQYTAKVLVALETALAIQRLSRSTEKRKIAVEIGLPRDARNLIENLKEEFRKRKVSLDSFGTIDTIPSMITTFEDVYIPQKDGKPFVDVSTFTDGNVDTRSKTDELKFLRDQLVASYGIPASFIGIEENLSNKAALSEENILFARTIISHQKYFTEHINELMEKVFNIVSPDEALTILENVNIFLSPPKSLQFERESRYTNDIVSLIESLERVGIPKEYSTKKYLTSIDWNEVENYQIDSEIDKTLGTSSDDEEGGGMGGY